MKNNKKGFTLAELLIVIAIMAILIAIAIPVFSAQLENARHAVDQSAERSAKSLAEAHYMLEHAAGDNEASTIVCTFGTDTAQKDNLSILQCTATLVDTSGTNKCTYATAKAGFTEIAPAGTCGETDCAKGKKLQVTVTENGVSGGWVTPVGP